MNEEAIVEGASCPVPIRVRGQVILGHGSGGKLTHDLIRDLFQTAFDNPVLNKANDAGVVISPVDRNLAISTDSHVVKPLFFPGGDIGRLAVCGTVNDISMMGAQPLYLTAGFILEEGLELGVLQRIVQSMCLAATEAGIKVIAGDTKVVEKGKADGVYINTTGIGQLKPDLAIDGALARPGDAILLSGPIGDHGIAVLAARGQLGFDTDVESDVAPLNNLVEKMLAKGVEIHVLRDPTRGGIATTLNEIAQQSQVGMVLDEELIQIRPAVQAACEMLGFDPLYIANEGRLLAIVGQEAVEPLLRTMRQARYGDGAHVIGEVVEKPTGRVLLKTAYGTTRVVDMLAGELLPRIC